jgi:hypothetical protein
VRRTGKEGEKKKNNLTQTAEKRANTDGRNQKRWDLEALTCSCEKQQTERCMQTMTIAVVRIVTKAANTICQNGRYEMGSVAAETDGVGNTERNLEAWQAHRSESNALTYNANHTVNVLIVP